jgi:glycosyltransferase involved in cell wall biosynthesis
MPLISIVSPVYKAEKNLPELVNRIEKSLKLITEDFEIILIDDMSPDKSWSIISQLHQINNKIIGIKLSRNFGQHAAITAGLDNVNGEWIVIMDCDLQDIPEEIPRLFNKTKEGFDIVLAKRKFRNDTFLKILLSKLFYKVLEYLTGIEQDARISNFGIYNKKVIAEISAMRESIRYFPSMVKWVGFKAAKIDVEHSLRLEGKSSYNFRKLFTLALDIILANSVKPIKLVVKFGFLVSFTSLLAAIVFFFKWLNGSIIILGYTSLIISVWLLSGLIMATLGVIGLYIGKTFEGVKKRPIYIIDKQLKCIIL